MIIKAIVELFTQTGREKIEVIITKDDLTALAESKAMQEYICNSCQCKNIHFVSHELL